MWNFSHDDFHKSTHLHETSTTHILSTHSYPISLRPILILSTRRGVGLSVYSVRSLLVSLILWTVQAACSPIRLLTPQGLDLERALPGGCMTTPSPASSAMSCSALTDCVVCACEHNNEPKAGDLHTTSRCSGCAWQFPGVFFLWKSTSFTQLVLRHFLRGFPT